MPYLEYEAQLRTLGPGVLTIGSGVEAGWRILGRDLASVHAIITLERDGRARLARGAGHADIFVNGAELFEDRAVLVYGDRFRLGGSAEFIYRQTAHQPRGDEGYLRDTKRGRLYKLGELTEIGRDPRCLVLLQDPEVSRVHAEVRYEEGRFIARPHGSAYTLLNTQRLLEPHPLNEGDELSIGRTVLRFSTEPPPSAVTASGAHHVHNKRAAKMQTVYMGALEAREKIRQRELRKVALIIAAVVAFLVAISVLVTG